MIESLALIGTTITNDDELVEAWLRGRPSTTVRVYRSSAERFRHDVGKPLDDVGPEDVLRWAQGFQGAEATVAKHVTAARSLLSFGFDQGTWRSTQVEASRCGPGQVTDRIVASTRTRFRP